MFAARPRHGTPIFRSIWKAPWAYTGAVQSGSHVACESHSTDGQPFPSLSRRNENLDDADRQPASGTHCAKASEEIFALRAAGLGRAGEVNSAGSWAVACVVIGEDVCAGNEISGDEPLVGCPPRGCTASGRPAHLPAALEVVGGIHLTFSRMYELIRFWWNGAECSTFTHRSRISQDAATVAEMAIFPIRNIADLCGRMRAPEEWACVQCDKVKTRYGSASEQRYTSTSRRSHTSRCLAAGLISFIT